VDFGEILDQWERGEGRQNKKKGPDKAGKIGKAGGSSGPEPHPLEKWLRAHEVYDKDAEDPEFNGEAESFTGLPAPERRRRLLARRPDAVIDLHGLTRDQAWSALERFFETGRQRAYEKLAIIHGKGNHSQGEAVLGRMVREYIEHCPFAGESGHSREGGTGATWVLLKETPGRT
jgi:DNA-nicking Smr family endonuclease